MGEISFIPKKKICLVEAVKILEYKRNKVQKSYYLKSKKLILTQKGYVTIYKLVCRILWIWNGKCLNAR